MRMWWCHPKHFMPFASLCFASHTIRFPACYPLALRTSACMHACKRLGHMPCAHHCHHAKAIRPQGWRDAFKAWLGMWWMRVGGGGIEAEVSSHATACLPAWEDRWDVERQGLRRPASALWHFCLSLRSGFSPKQAAAAGSGNHPTQGNVEPSASPSLSLHPSASTGPGCPCMCMCMGEERQPLATDLSGAALCPLPAADTDTHKLPTPTFRWMH